MVWDAVSSSTFLIANVCGERLKEKENSKCQKMIYTNIKFTAASILIAVLLSTANAKPGVSLKDKLARLFMDPANDAMNNEIFDHDDEDWQQRNQLRGMLLQNSELPGRIMKNNVGLQNLFKNFKGLPSMNIFDDTEEVATTTTKAPPTQVPNIVMVGMAPIRSMFNRFFEVLRNYSN